MVTLQLSMLQLERDIALEEVRKLKGSLSRTHPLPVKQTAQEVLRLCSPPVDVVTMEVFGTPHHEGDLISIDDVRVFLWDRGCKELHISGRGRKGYPATFRVSLRNTETVRGIAGQYVRISKGWLSFSVVA